ncbi:energy transducer TonB family protein [Veillonella agrestimuris]|uniref:energy transducer TonB family protein n=1 Tax=Veillonella agrestimuris TaxID=2941340 RepID=UPI00203EA82E|nr:energy transducer TonB [Veillonella agrestimuris]
MKLLNRFILATAALAVVSVYTPANMEAAEVVSPPKEVSIVKPVMPAIPEGSVVADTMRIRFLIDKDGDVKSVFVEQSSGYSAVDEAVKAAVKQWKFTPAIGKDKKPKESIIGMTITLPVRK